MSATVTEAAIADARSTGSDEPYLFMLAFHAAVNSAGTHREDRVWREAVAAGAAAVAGHIEGQAAVQARTAARPAFVPGSKAFLRWRPRRDKKAVAA